MIITNGRNIELAAYFMLGACMALSAWKDFRTRTISAWTCILFGTAGIVLTAACAVVLKTPSLLIEAGAGLFPAAVLFVVGKITKGAIGTGDVMLFAVSGVYLGLTGNIIFIWVTCFFTLAAGGVLAALGRIKRKDSLPMGPFALMAWAALGLGGILL